jgi:hypothetical protein
MLARLPTRCSQLGLNGFKSGLHFFNHIVDECLQLLHAALQSYDTLLALPQQLKQRPPSALAIVILHLPRQELIVGGRPRN